MHTAKIFRIGALALLFSTSAWADRAYVAPASGTGATSEETAVATDLVRASVSELSPGTELVNQASRADFVLEPKLIRLGRAFILSLSRVKNGDVLATSQLKAEKMDELDKVARRVTRSVLEGKSGVSNPRVGEVTNQEAKEGAQRRPARKSVYLGFGAASLNNLNATGIGYSIAGAYTWDVNSVRIKIMGEGDVNGAAFFASGGLGGNYYLGTEDTAPYLSADFGGGAAKIDQGITSGQTVGGFVLGAGGGVEFLRTASVNLDLSFHGSFLLHDNQFGMPQAYSVRLGIYF